jgi:uncharacterized SAM-binding protein YcdF (DUF218 family)
MRLQSSHDKYPIQAVVRLPAAIPEKLNRVSTSLRFRSSNVYCVQKEIVAAPTWRRMKTMRLLRVLVFVPPLLFGLAMLLLDRYGQTDRARRAGAIVVLGAAVNAYGLPGPSLRARTLHAVELYRRGVAPVIIFTGGVGKNPPAESKVAAALAMRRGVPRSAIFSEETSTNTWQNIENTTQICGALGVQNVVVVSDPYHLWRAQRNFAAQGIQAYPSPTGNRETWLRVLMAAREVISVSRDCLTGRLKT